jgi:DUF4097 and DUF4098 domain-containing protein YvlB
MNVRKIALLFAILATGAFLETAFQVRSHVGIGPSGCRVIGGRFYGASYRFEESAGQALRAGQPVEVENAFGAVRVVAGPPGEARIALAKVVYLPTEDQAREFAQGIKLLADESGRTVRIRTNREELQRGRDIGFETHFTITVPPDTPVSVKNEHGEVQVEDVASAVVDSSFDSLRVVRVAGSASLKSRHGDVRVTGIGGDLRLESRHGGVEVKEVAGKATVDVHNGDVSVEDTGALEVEVKHGSLKAARVKGDLDVRGEHAGVEASEVTGAARVASSYGSVTVQGVGGDAQLRAQHGGVTAQDVKGSLRADASFDQVKLERIGGPIEVEVEHGGLEARTVGKGVKAKTTGDSVAVADFEGPAEVKVERGSVELRPARPVSESFVVSATHGGIRIDVPAQSRFEIEAEVERGEIGVDLPGIEVTQATDKSFKGRLGDGGGRMRLRAEGGDVEVTSHAATVSRE